MVWVLPKKKKHGQPKKNPKATKSTEVTPQKSTTTAVGDAVVPDESPEVNKSTSPIPPSDMIISKVGQALAADIEIVALAAAAASASASTSAAVATNPCLHAVVYV